MTVSLFAALFFTVALLAVTTYFILGSLPLLVFFFFLQRQIIAGITAGSVKG